MNFDFEPSYIILKNLAITPITNRARIIVIGETFFFSNLQIPRVSRSGTRPGISESKFCCKVVTFTGSRAVGPIAENCLRAAWIPSAPAGRAAQSMYEPGCFF